MQTMQIIPECIVVGYSIVMAQSVAVLRIENNRVRRQPVVSAPRLRKGQFQGLGACDARMRKGRGGACGLLSL